MLLLHRGWRPGLEARVGGALRIQELEDCVELHEASPERRAARQQRRHPIGAEAHADGGGGQQKTGPSVRSVRSVRV